MLLTHGIFGVGGLLGPIMVYIFEVQAFAVVGLLILFTLPAYLLLPPPEYSSPKMQNGNNE